MEHFVSLSDKALDFINAKEILRTLDYAKEHRNDKGLIAEIMAKAREKNGLYHEEAAVLLLNNDPEVTSEIKALAGEIKLAYYGNRIVLFAPLYISNLCSNGCIYCPYHAKNHSIDRLQMTPDQIKAEVLALQKMGHKRIALEAGEHKDNSIDYIIESMNTIYSLKSEYGVIRRINVNIAATTVENYKRLVTETDLGTYVLFQETYNKTDYEKLHPSGPKSDYFRQTEAMDRAMQAGIKDVGLGVLFGLHSYEYELVGLLMHAEHLEAAYGVGPHTISVPRLRPANDIDVSAFKNALPDDVFLKLIALLRISVPYTGMIMSTRESEQIRKEALSLGISQISGGSKTTVGGYANENAANNSAQFEVSDNRTLDEVVRWLMKCGHVPSFCTACYGKDRQGMEFMDICKKKQIHTYCTRNALLTLMEYINKYASPETRRIGTALLDREFDRLPPRLVNDLFTRIQTSTNEIKLF